MQVTVANMPGTRVDVSLDEGGTAQQALDQFFSKAGGSMADLENADVRINNRRINVADAGDIQMSAEDILTIVGGIEAGR